jgi:fructokinase
MVSRVGADRLGEEALRRAAWYGVDADLVQVDPTLPTGFVRVTLDPSGKADYEIVAPAAWDAIESSEPMLRRAARARAIVFGSLAQRAPVSRATIESLWDSGALLVFVANLRPPHDDREVVRRSLRHAAVVKVTDVELRRLASWFDLPLAGQPTVRTVGALAETFGCHTVCVTRGPEGAALWRDGRWTESPGFQVEVRDTVGAGDAFLAVLLAGLLAGAEDGALLQNAALIGAYVATQSGAVPVDQSATIAPLRAPEADAGLPPVPAKERGRRARGKPPPRGGRSGD